MGRRALLGLIARVFFWAGGRIYRSSRFFRLFTVVIIVTIILGENIAIVFANLCGMSLLRRSSLNVRA